MIVVVIKIVVLETETNSIKIKLLVSRSFLNQHNISIKKLSCLILRYK